MRAIFFADKLLPGWMARIAISLAILFAMGSVFAQDIAVITVKHTPDTIPVPVSINLGPVTVLVDSALQLFRVDGTSRTPVPFQIENGEERKLWWVVKKRGGGDAVFHLVKGHAATTTPTVSYFEQDSGLVIANRSGNVLRYNYGVVEPPEGVDTVFRRSGFIHPLWSPDKTVLTRISPWDHRHHFGIWNPWTSVEWRGREIDFWNLAKKEGTVRFAKFISKETGRIFGGFSALQEHVAFAGGAGEVVMNETWNIRVFDLGMDMYLWDFTSILNSATDDPVRLKKYTYGGGLAFRATAEWSKTNSQALTSHNKDRNNGNETVADWCRIEGKSDSGTSGILFMSSPSNYNSPQPIRIYPQDWYQGSGDLFFNFTPVLTTSWNLLPGTKYAQRYRILVYKGSISEQTARAVWEHFAKPPEIIIKKLHQRAR